MRSLIFKRIAIGCVAALLLLMGYYWTQRVPVTASSSVARSQPTPAAVADIVAVAPEISAIDTVLTTKEPTRRKPSAAPTPMPAPRPDQPADRPAALEQKPAPAAAAEKPTPPACDQLVMRNGDLIDAKVLEVGVNEIRYRRCHREDGPEYVVSKADVLSIRYGNGDIDRFSWRTVRARRSEVAQKSTS